MEELEHILRELAARASFIGERRAPELVRDTAAEKIIAARLEAWTQAVSEEGERATLERMWEWDGMDERAAREMVAPVVWRDDAPLPEWANALRRVLSAPPDNLPEGVLVADAPIAFQELWLPFAGYMQRALAENAGYDLLTPQAQAQLPRNLMQALARYAAEPLFLEFQALRGRQGFGALAALAAKAGKAPGDALYRRFIAQMQASGFLKFLAKYPVLARILGEFAYLNTETRRRFLTRLAADVEDLARVFNDGAPMGRVTELALGLSDLHRGGDTVTAVKFETGPRLVYKPKDLGTEQSFNALVRWLNEHGAPLELCALTVLNRGTHGWVTFAEHTECADENAVRRHYFRVGMLLALSYALEATDCHYENLIARGEHPVLIDHETLFHHRVPEETTEELRESALFRGVDEFNNSVLRVGLLPGWRMGKDKRVVYDASGLGGYGGQQMPFRRNRLVNPNTDAMEMRLETAQLGANPNIPLMNGAPAQLEQHTGDVVEGFRAMYEFLLRVRAQLLAPDSPLMAFRDKQVRFVFRSTQVYGSLLKQAQQPAYLRDGAEYSIYLERLARAHLQLDFKPSCYPLLAAERHDMAQLDTPFFTARTESADLDLDLPGTANNVVRHYFTGPSFELAVARIHNLSPQDLERQTHMMEMSLQLRFADEVRAARQSAEAAAAAPPRRVATSAEPTADELIAAAIALGEEHRAHMLTGEDGSATWIGPMYMPDSGRYQLSISSSGMYEGLAGIGLYFAALACVTGDAEWRALAHATFKPLREGLEKEFDTTVENLSIGGASGLGSLVYALARSGALLDDEALVDGARRGIRRLTPQHIQADKSYDVIGGSAGAILALVALYETSGEPVALERARDAARHLLGSRMTSEKGYRAWKAFSSYPLTGFSHGAAGIALALLRLYRHTGDEELLRAAQEAVAFEATEFDAARNNWFDLRDNLDGTPYNRAEPKFAAAWCHGAPGIALARIAGLGMLDNPQVRQDIEAGLATTQRTLGTLELQPDHLCCGNTGRIEIAWTAGEKLARPELAAQARALAGQMIVNARERGGYSYTSFTARGAFCPGLFQGGAGIGYLFLRMARPGRLPNVLLWE